MFGSHEIKRQELQELNQGQPGMIIVGTGTDGAACIAPEAESWAEANNVSLLIHRSYDAIVRLNALSEQKRGVAALIHTTC